jgi:hypothetical protein
MRVCVNTALTALVATVLALSACSPSGFAGGSDSQAQRPSASCEDVMQSVLQRERVGDTAGAINGEMQFLLDNCPSQYDAITGFIAAKIAIVNSGFEPCPVWPQRVGEAAAALLQNEGLCQPEQAPADTEESSSSGQPNGGTPWDQASGYVGTTQRVCGPLRSQRPWNDSVFLNIGRDYPDPGRFVIVLWDVGAVETISAGVMLCAEGQITSYEGVPQIELNDPGRVEIWE